jgi:Flp pilus assembly protein TadB
MVKKKGDEKKAEKEEKKRQKQLEKEEKKRQKQLEKDSKRTAKRSGPSLIGAQRHTLQVGVCAFSFRLMVVCSVCVCVCVCVFCFRGRCLSVLCSTVRCGVSAVPRWGNKVFQLSL